MTTVILICILLALLCIPGVLDSLAVLLSALWSLFVLLLAGAVCVAGLAVLALTFAP